MPLTPEERAELDALDSYFADQDERKKGQATVDAFAAARRLQAPTGSAPATRPFSIYRSVVGGVRDAFEGVLDTIDDAGDFLGEATGIGGIAFGSSASNGIIEYQNFEEFNRRGGDSVFGRAGQETEFFAQPEGSADAGTAERLVRGLVGFAVPFTAYMRATTALRGFGVAGRMAQGLAAGAAADFTQVDPVGGNIANILRDTFGLDNAMLDSLASEEDDGALMARFKAAAAGAPLGLAGDAVFEAGGRLLKLYRVWKGTADEAAATVASFKQGPVKVDLPSEPRKVEAVEADEVINPSDKPAAGEAEEFVYSPRKDGEPEDFEDVLDFLKSKAGGVDMDEETFGRFAKNLIEGDPENALAKLGIDPLKIDFSKYTDADMLGRLHKGLAEVYEGIATRLGRSNTRVSEKTIIRGAEALASTPDVLRDLYGSTSKLAEQVTAGRLFVGAHATKLLGDAQAALRELEQGGTGEAWAQFLESFHRHAYFMGALRGAGSEVGRALRSLQIIARAKPKKAAELLGDAVEADTAAGAARLGRMNVEEGASAFADSLGTDAEKIAALRRLIDLRGDVSELSRTVREGNGVVLRRMNQALKETMGSLFSTATATYNVAAGVTFLGLNGLGRLGAAMLRTPGLAVGGRAAMEARRAWLETWAYTEGVLGGFKEAYGNTLAVLEREVLSEASINLDGLGLEKLAKRSALGSAKAGGKITGHFERADVVSTKAFAMTTAERRAFEKAAAELGGPRFFQAGLQGLARLTGGVVNAAGSAFRTGTTLFINLPDEFVGTLATRAGAYAEAVRIASREAADMELGSKQVGEYIKARAIQLFGDGPKGWSPEGVDGGAHHAIARAGDTEARAVLFQDELEFGVNRALARAVNATGGVGSLIIPFIKTPLRILERTMVDYTPLGLLTARLRQGIAAGGAQRDEVLARLSLGLIAMSTAFQLADERDMVGLDGGYLSTARDAGRPSYSLRIGDDVYEFSRIDPIGTLLGFGADMRAFMDAAGDDPEAQSTAMEAIKAMLVSISMNTLSKTWLTSIKNLTDLAGATSQDDFGIRWDKFTEGLAGRFIPAAGIQRAAEGWTDGVMREAAGFSDGLLKSTLGADQLPIRRDFLGREVHMSGMGRIAGIRGDVMPFDGDDPVMAEMERLSFREPAGARRQKGVKLNASQFSRFLQLRGQEVRDPHTGLTMEEALNQLVQMPEFQSLPKAAKVAEIRKTTRGYSDLAAEALTTEDQSYAYARLRAEVFELSAMEGWEPERRDTELTRFAEQLGLQPQ